MVTKVVSLMGGKGKKFGVVCFALMSLGSLSAIAQPAPEQRWDLTIQTPKETYPSWIGVTDEGGTTVVRVVGSTGSAHIAINVLREGSKLSFQSKESFGREMNVTWTFNQQMTAGLQKREDGVEGQIIAVRAPRLDESFPSKWKDPEKILNGRDLSGWQAAGDPRQKHWRVENGVLLNDGKGANLVTTRKFKDFKLHIEYLCPEGGNSGVYLRGRYEIQIEYAKPKEDALHSMGSVYGFVAPSPTGRIPERPGEWESYDITLVGRRVTAYRDGKQILDAEEIPGITGGALDSKEDEPGPLYLQGDHSGGLKFRNITISVPQGR